MNTNNLSAHELDIYESLDLSEIIKNSLFSISFIDTEIIYIGDVDTCDCVWQAEKSNSHYYFLEKPMQDFLDEIVEKNKTSKPMTFKKLQKVCLEKCFDLLTKRLE